MSRSGAVRTDAHELMTKGAKRKVRLCDYLSLGKICPLNVWPNGVEGEDVSTVGGLRKECCSRRDSG